MRQKQFVTNAGHELKTPLAIIMTNTEALELFNGESKWTRNIKAQTKRLSGLMQNLLTLSKMDEADLKLPMQYFDLGELIKEAAAPFEVPAHEKKLEFIIETPQIKVNANRDTIGQLIGINVTNRCTGVRFRKENTRCCGSRIRSTRPMWKRIRRNCLTGSTGGTKRGRRRKADTGSG